MKWSWKKDCNTVWEIIFIKPIMNYKSHQKKKKKGSPRRECQGNDMPLREGPHKVLNMSSARASSGQLCTSTPRELAQFRETIQLRETIKRRKFHSSNMN